MRNTAIIRDGNNFYITVDIKIAKHWNAALKRCGVIFGRYVDYDNGVAYFQVDLEFTPQISQLLDYYYSLPNDYAEIGSNLMWDYQGLGSPLQDIDYQYVGC